MPSVTLRLVKFRDADTGAIFVGKPIQFQSSPPPTGSRKWIDEGGLVKTDVNGDATSISFTVTSGPGHDFRAVFAGDTTTLPANIRLLNQTIT